MEPEHDKTIQAVSRQAQPVSDEFMDELLNTFRQGTISPHPDQSNMNKIMFQAGSVKVVQFCLDRLNKFKQGRTVVTG